MKKCKKISLLCAALLWGTLGLRAQQFAKEQFKDADPKELIQRTDFTEGDLGIIQRYFQFELKDRSRADELAELIIQKNPKGNFARLTAFQKLSSVNTNEVIIMRYENFLKAFPPQKGADGIQGSGSFVYYQVNRRLGTAYFETRRLNELVAFTKGLDFKSENEIFRWNIMRAYVFKSMRLDSLYEVSTPLIKDLLGKVQDGSYQEHGVFNEEQALANAREQLDNQLSTYISILFDSERYQEAKHYFDALSDSCRYATGTLNLKHMQVLDRLGKKEAVLPLLENCVAANVMTSEMLDRLKTIYIEKHGNTDAYDQYFERLQSSHEQEELKTYVKAHMMQQEFVPFAMEDADGDLIRSSDWDEKIVVIDFWATWCKPCIAAFPGMQLVVDKYASDDQVAVFFVGTMQTGDYKKKSTDFVHREGYRFHLLHDNLNPKTGNQDAVFRTFAPFFNSSGIPRKVILKDGYLRYTSEGYSGSPSKLLDELSYAIELLKSEKNGAATE